MKALCNFDANGVAKNIGEEVSADELAQAGGIEVLGGLVSVDEAVSASADEASADSAGEGSVDPAAPEMDVSSPKTSKKKGKK